MMDVAFATSSRIGRTDTKLLVIQKDQIEHLEIDDLVDIIPENSVLVVNTAATLPASLPGRAGSLSVELRLVSNLGSRSNIKSWRALVFYEGNWRQLTESRMNPDFLEVGDVIMVGELEVEIRSILHSSKRFVEIQFNAESSQIWETIYKLGKPIQYSHLNEDLNLWDVQTIFASIPVAIEPPSAAFQLRWDLINRLISKGIGIVDIVHATSISSTGIKDIDQDLPFPERYWITPEAASQLSRAKKLDKTIIAIGTSVTRALEDNFMRFEDIKPGEFLTTLKIDPDHPRRFVTGLFTGMHLPEESHLQLLQNFVPEDVLNLAYDEAVERGYLWHEYGDVSLLLD